MTMLESVTRYVPNRSASLKGGGDNARIPVSLPRVKILEREDGEARPRWQGRPVNDAPPFVYGPHIRPTVEALRRAPSPPKPVEKPVQIRHTSGRAYGSLAPLTWASPIANCAWATPRHPFAKMLSLAAYVSGVSIGEIQSEQRVRIIVRARWLAAWLGMRFTSLSIAEIGRRLGGRDHATLINARDRMMAALGSRALSSDPDECAQQLWDVLRVLK